LNESIFYDLNEVFWLKLFSSSEFFDCAVIHRKMEERKLKASVPSFHLQLKKFDWAEVLKEAAIFSYIYLESAF